MTGRFPPSVARHVEQQLALAGCVAADEEAEELLAGAGDLDVLASWVDRRRKGEPLAWITGSLRFCGAVVLVEPGLYVPRIQSETLAARAAELLPHHGHAADLCTGTGVIAAHLARSVPSAVVIGTDVDPAAARCGARNGVHCVVADLGSCLPTGRFDLVVAVTPYVPTAGLRLLPADTLRYEPRSAIDGGVDGLDLVTRVVDDAGRLLRRGGWLLTEIGGDQDLAIEPCLNRAGFDRVSFWYDGDGDLRGVAAQARSTPNGRS